MKLYQSFRPIPEDIELEGEKSTRVDGFSKHHSLATKLEFGGKRATALNRDCTSTKMKLQSENSNTTQINVRQTTETAANNTQRIEESSEDHRPTTERSGQQKHPTTEWTSFTKSHR